MCSFSSLFFCPWFFYAHLFDQVDTGLQVHAKVDERPLDPLFLVLFLLQHKHVVVEELLQLFVGEVDAQLLKRVELQTGQY